jgi:hypothetical protein
MSNPKTPFSWQMPTATDLVTDLPADFEVFGQAVATSMADLLGGTSGQILAKNSNTDMDFTWIPNDQGDITGVTAGTGITGGGTSGTVTVTNDMATTITAAGDIVVGTGSGTYDNLPIGTTAQVLTADTTVSPYKVKWATPATSAAQGVSVYNTVGYTLANNTFTALTFNSEDFDTDAFHSTVTNTSRLTVPAGLGGKYSIKAQLLFNVNATGFRNIKIYKNGVAVRASVEAIPSSTIYVGLVMSTDLTLIATDYIELFAYQNSGGNLTVYPTLADGQFSMMYWGS